MRKLLAIAMLTVACNASAEITSKAQADKFLDQYCIALVNQIEKAVTKQKVEASREDWKSFLETGAWIGGLADVYSKLCKG